MKRPVDGGAAFRSGSRRTRGVALVIVMAFLVLITVLVLAFFSSVQTEYIGATRFAAGTGSKQLADSAVQAVMGTVKLATSGATSSGSVVAWASQPGMIRTYDAGGNPLNCYKLYSSSDLVTTTGTVFDAASDLDSNWSTKPALFTDMNSPVLSGSDYVFPIIDGNAVKTLTKTSAAVTGATPHLAYDANADGAPDVEGFWVDPASSLINNKYNEANPVSPSNSPVPMPVKWIYMLRDGTLTAPDPTGSTVATFDSAPAGKQPTESNPITGRIAYWTDDETSKVNINTASEGSYWDMPRTNGTTDVSYANYQPVNHEFQRYPGHPATTSLSPVFSSLWAGLSASEIIDQNEKMYGIAPRVEGGGSKGGTVKTIGSPSIAKINSDINRLYASIDELMFSATDRAAKQGFTKSQLGQSRFFITTSSRAPDVNLFNKPRVSLWPLASSSGNDYRTTYDNIIAFCSTSGSNAGTGGGNIYYFQRANSDSPTADLLQTAPGNTSTYDGRNRMLLEYLRYLSSQEIPGFGGNFQSKYSATGTGTGAGTDCDQIVTEIFDYIRCVNMNDKQLVAAAGGSAKPFAPGAATGLGTGQIVPIQDGSKQTRGFGRYCTVGKAFMAFIGNAQNPVPGGTFTNLSGVATTVANSTAVPPLLSEMNPYYADTNPTGVLPGRIRVQAAFFIDPFCCSHGPINLIPNFKVKVDGLDALQWGPIARPASPVPMGFPVSDGTTRNGTLSVALTPMGMPASATFTTPAQYPIAAQPWGSPYTSPSYWALAKISLWRGGGLGFMSLVLGKGASGSSAYPLCAQTSTTSSSSGGVVTATTSDFEPQDHFYFKGGPITVTIYNSAGNTVVQTLHLTLPDSPPGGFPVPKLAPTNPVEGKVDNTGYDRLGNFRYFVTGKTTILSGKSKTDVANRIGQTGGGGRLNSVGDGTGIFEPCAWIIDTDVVRSVEAASGDVRLVAAQTDVPGTLFAPHVYYSDTTKSMAHSLRGTWNNPYYGATVGRLFNLATGSASLATTSYGGNMNLGLVTGQWAAYGYSNNSAVDDPGNPSITGTGIWAGGTGGNAAVLGDWDNASGNCVDGPFINKTDEGDGNASSGMTPYYQIYSGAQVDPQSTLFSPNRQVPSAVTLGSLPTGVFANKPWQTLLFRSLPIGHPGLGTSTAGGGDSGPPYNKPPDHLFLDLFSMPVVEPYPISEPLSTAGRINMNYQIAPFKYINRDTGIRAVLKGEQVISIADSDSTTYKKGSPAKSFRYPVNIDETLNGFVGRFSKNDIFHSASEICGIHIVPLDPNDPNATYAKMPAYWWQTASYTSPAQGHRPTGDNSRERIYATVYPRLTTKSNTFTVHFRVQALKKAQSTSASVWDESKDVVLSESRGSQTIERYVDPNDPAIPDYADPTVYSSSNATVNPPIDKFYKFRILSTTKFPL